MARRTFPGPVTVRPSPEHTLQREDQVELLTTDTAGLLADLQTLEQLFGPDGPVCVCC